MIQVATRKSPLALKQTELVMQTWQQQFPTLSYHVKPMTTEGDQRLDQSLAKIGGKGLFIKELEKALLDGAADLAIHSMKDMPTELHPELDMISILPRIDVHDAFISDDYPTFLALPSNAVVGTSSLRRAAQLKAWRDDITIKPLRGNVNTRLKKLKAKEYDAIILAAAGLKRLNMDNRITEILPVEKCLPAAGQGALCVEFRKNDITLKKQLMTLNQPDVDACIQAERAVTIALQASCHTPVAAYAAIENNQLQLRSMVATPDGSCIIHASASGNLNQAGILGQQAAKQLNEQGAQVILKSW